MSQQEFINALCEIDSQELQTTTSSDLLTTNPQNVAGTLDFGEDFQIDIDLLWAESFENAELQNQTGTKRSHCEVNDDHSSKRLATSNNEADMTPTMSKSVSCGPRIDSTMESTSDVFRSSGQSDQRLPFPQTQTSERGGKLNGLLSLVVFGIAVIVALLVYTNLNVNVRTPRVTEKLIILDWTGNNRNGFEEHFVENCLVTRSRSLLLHSQAVVITHRAQLHIDDFPTSRHSWQKWVWLMDESPRHTFGGLDYNFYNIRNMFNWTMTYKTSSDVYVPYGWTERREAPTEVPDYFRNRTKLAVSVISNCWTHNDERLTYVKNLQKFVSVDMYGTCSGNECKGHVGAEYNANCEQARNYLFYLAFENSNCKEYITEKTFAHGFSMGNVPVVMGATKEDYIAITPPHSFIHVSDFAGPSELAQYLTFLSQNRTEYMKYHEWRSNYTTSYRVQYVTDEPLWTSLCEALNRDNGEVKTYADLTDFWSEAECH